MQVDNFMYLGHCWIHNGCGVISGDKEVISSSHGGTLTLQEVTAEDAGEYTCVASNEAGTSSDIIHVEVGSK